MPQNVKTPDDALSLIVRAIEAAGYRPGKDIALALDPAASELWADGGTTAFLRM